MKSLVVASLLILAITGCSGPVVSISLGQPTTTPTATETSTPTVVPTATPNLEATATAAAQATATAQAAATAQAQATANAQSTATAQAQATSRAQQTATAAAQGTATAQAFIAGVNAIAASAKKAYGPTEGKLEGENTVISPGSYVKNFVLDIQIFNPSDRAVHPWNFSVIFRYVTKLQNYRLVLDSEGTWRLYKPDKSLADAVQVTRLGSGIIRGMNLLPTGSNQIRFVVQDTAAFLFVNGEFVTPMDVSEVNYPGDLAILTGDTRDTNFPGLSMRYKDFTISSLP